MSETTDDCRLGIPHTRCDNCRLEEMLAKTVETLNNTLITLAASRRFCLEAAELMKNAREDEKT